MKDKTKDVIVPVTDTSNPPGGFPPVWSQTFPPKSHIALAVWKKIK